MAGAAAGLCFLGLWVLAAPGAGASTTGQRVVGAVYTQTNSPSGNSVVVFNRFANGKLKKRQSVPTGGKGSTQSVGCGPGCPILDSQTAVVVSKSGKLVFAVNAGSDTVTSFRKTPSGLKRVSQVSSGGKMPESLALHGNLLYVLNVATENGTSTGNIYGLRISSSGKLSPVGSSRPLANLAPPDHSADPRAMDFKPNGKVIVVTELAAGFMGTGPPGRIDTFVVGSNGKAGPAVAHPTSDALPFGFAFDNRSHVVVSQIRSPAGNVDGSISTYKVTDSGGVTPIDTKPSSGILPCWVAVSSDGRYAYLVNTGAGHPAPVTRFRVGSTGTLTPLSPPAASRSGEFARTDAALSRGSTFLYVLAPKVGPGNASHIDEYRRTANGGLKFIGSTQPGANIGIGATGLAAR
ncbi:MAG TPA: beta-propeller fold lactonase family protein [Gaiellaceae bacterium]|nr:beta-propeller fold lactonase family protein [Gaiellaceae bacterium]